MSDQIDRLKAALADRYTIDRELGQGGMATVYLAEDIKHHRKVAIKLLKPELAAVLGADRFVQEITTTAALQHPHILPLFDSGTADGFLYYVMPFIDGETLRDTLNRETQLGVDDAVRITSEVADALDYAHRNGVIHRDIKPENILMHDGRPMVADFGIALAVSAAAGGRMTETGLSLGTPHYMSPEQATAEKEITARSDVYSLGSVLYEMLTGEPPHMGNSAQAIIMKIVTEEAAPVTKLRKAVPPNVAAAVAKSLEKLAADRFESAKEFGNALNDRNFATTAMPAAVGVVGKSTTRNALIGGLVLGAVSGAVAMMLLSSPEQSQSRITRDQLTFNGQAHTPAISPDGERVAYVVDACERGALSCTVSLEVLEIGGTKAQVLIPAAIGLRSPRWSHDGETVVVGGALDRGRFGVFAIPRLSGTPRLIHQGAFEAYDTHPTSDSVLVMSSDTDSISVIGLNDREIYSRIPADFSQVSEIAWSPDGGRLAVMDGAGLHVIDRDGAVLGSIPPPGSRIWLRWSTGGGALLYFRTGRAREDELVRREVAGDGSIAEEELVIMPRTPTMYDGEFDVARRSGRLVMKTGDPITDLWSFDLLDRPVSGARETHGTTWYGDPTLSIDDRSILFYRGDALGDNIYRLDRESGVEMALTDDRGPGANTVRISADGGVISYGRYGAERTLEVMELPSTQVTSIPSAIMGDPVPNGSGGFLAASSIDGSLVVLDSIKGDWRALTNPDSVGVWRIAVSPDGLNAIFTGDLLERESFRSIVGSVPIAGGELTILASLTESELPQGLSVGSDGTVYLSRWINGDDHPSIWRLTGDGGPLERWREIPEKCMPRSLVVGWSGQTAVCGVDDFRSDIWTVDLGEATR